MEGELVRPIFCRYKQCMGLTNSPPIDTPPAANFATTPFVLVLNLAVNWFGISTAGGQARASGFLPVQDWAGLRSRTNRRRRTHLTLLIESRRRPHIESNCSAFLKGRRAFSIWNCR